MRTWLAAAAALAAITSMVQCHFLTGDYQTADEPLGTGGGGGDTATTTTSTSAGGATTALVSQNLLARYFLDDAIAGETPQQAADSSAVPVLPINIEYDADEDAGAPNGVAWTEQEGNRGLAWQRPNREGRADSPIPGTKITDSLEASTAVTLELVTKLEGTVDDTRLLILGGGDGGILSLRVHDETQLDLQYSVDLAASPLAEIGLWQVGLLERHVLHLVIDTTAEQDDDRAQLFVDGLVVSSSSDTPLARNDALAIGDGELIIGNDGSWNSIQGTVFYAAIYGTALTTAQIANNVSILTADDDTPE